MAVDANVSTVLKLPSNIDEHAGHKFRSFPFYSFVYLEHQKNLSGRNFVFSLFER